MKILKPGFLLIITVMSHWASAEWLCSEAGITRTGNSFNSCGVAQHSEEGVARALSLDKAREEFMSVCELSADCKKYEVIVEPKRLECLKQDGLFVCRRLVVYHITNNRKELALNKAALEKQIRLQEKELRELRQEEERLRSLYHLQKESEVHKANIEAFTSKRNLERIEFEINRKESDLESSQLKFSIEEDRPNYLFRVNIASSSSPIKEYSFTSAGYRIDAYYRFSDWFGLELNLEPNTTFKKSNHEGATSALALGVPISLKLGKRDPTAIYVKPLVEYRQSRIQRNDTMKIYQNGYGAALGRDFLYYSPNWKYGLNIETGYRKYEDTPEFRGSSSFYGSIGFSFGW